MERCPVLGLRRGDCSQWCTTGKTYCYYHDKLQRKAISTHCAPNSRGRWLYWEEIGHEDPEDWEWNTVPPEYMYPVWPLPKDGRKLKGLMR